MVVGIIGGPKCRSVKERRCWKGRWQYLGFEVSLIQRLNDGCSYDVPMSYYDPTRFVCLFGLSDNI